MKRDDAEEFTQSLGQIVGGSWRQIALAKRLGVPEALGLETEQWVRERLGGYVKMSIPERRGAVEELAAEGHSNREIGNLLGVDEGTVRGDRRAENSAPDGKNGTEISTRAENSAPKFAGCTIRDLHTAVAEGRKFGCIYADPPWLYDNQGTRAATTTTEKKYYSLTIDELCSMPVRSLAADDCHLHLWTTNGFLFECPRIFKAWGFEFRSSFVWVKPQMGIGNYWRNSHEFLLTAIRGDAKRFNDHSLKSWASYDRGAHSSKPEQLRRDIERASSGPYLELFGRHTSPGWSVWGNQIERTIFNAATLVEAAE